MDLGSSGNRLRTLTSRVRQISEQVDIKTLEVSNTITGPSSAVANIDGNAATATKIDTDGAGNYAHYVALVT